MSTTTTTPAAAVAYALRWPALFVILAAEVMDLLDALITSIAGPTIVRDLGGGETLIQWLAAGYTIAMASGLLIGGRLGDIYGRRRMFMIGMTGFTLMSAACALVPVAGDADHLPGAPGSDRRRDAAAGPRPDQGDVPARGHGRRVRRLRPDHGALRCRRSDPGRLAGRRRPVRLGLAHDLRDQHPDRRRRAARCRPGAAGVPARPAVRIDLDQRARSRGRLDGPADLPAHPGPRARLAALVAP